MTARELRDRLNHLIECAREDGYEGSAMEVCVDWRKLLESWGGPEGAAPEVPINLADLEKDEAGPYVVIQ